jgi:hypothetical protein
MEVAATHPGGLDGDNDLAGAGAGIGEFTKLELAVSEKHHAAHATLLRW